VISQSNRFTVHGSQCAVRGGRVNYNTITTNVLTPRLLFDSSFCCCSYSANCVIMFSYTLVITRKSNTSKRCLNSSVQSDPDDLVVHREQSMKLWRVALWSLCHSSECELMARGSNLAKLVILSHPCQRLKLRYKTIGC